MAESRTRLEQKGTIMTIVNHDYIMTAITGEIERLGLLDDITLIRLTNDTIIFTDGTDTGTYPISPEILAAIEATEEAPELWDNIAKFEIISV
jgi:hypothetical protein